MAVYIKFTDGSDREFKDGGRGQPTYRYSLGAGGVLLVMRTEDGLQIAQSEVETAYSPHAWTRVAGLAFGDSVFPAGVR